MNVDTVIVGSWRGRWAPRGGYFGTLDGLLEICQGRVQWQEAVPNCLRGVSTYCQLSSHFSF